jgi:anionic cell wall polymer biosynthesis LytR-Cps2A-Psr (LCP) family protein
MNGKKALAYVRMRYADPKGDLGRIQRQQQFMSAVLHKAATPSTLLNPIAMKNLSEAGTSSVIVGETDGVMDIAKLGMAMRNISKGQGKVMTVPISDPNATTAAGSSVLWNHKKADELFKSLGAR